MSTQPVSAAEEALAAVVPVAVAQALDSGPLVAVEPVRRLRIGARGTDALTDVVAALAVLVTVAPAGIARPHLAAGLVLGWMLVQWTVNRPSPLDPPTAALGRVWRGTLAAGAACWAVEPWLSLPERRLALFVAGTALVSMGLRCLTLRLRARTTLETLVVADRDEFDSGIEHVTQASGGRLTPVGVCAPEDLDETLAVTRPDAVMVVPCAQLQGRRLQRLSWRLEAAGLPFLVSTRLSDVAAERARVRRVGTLDVLHVDPADRRGAPALGKMAWDRGVALLMLVLLSPLLLGVALAVRLDSAGPVLFRQRRVGRDGQVFTMLKFRSMVPDATGRLAALRALDESDGVLFKIRADPRVTRVGRVLRKYSLDELPQLVNVLRGEMSLVGPRPALPDEVAAYDFDPRRRLAVKPGLTGLWQVSGRSDLSWEDAVRLDLDYVDNWSMRRDLVILLRTVRAVLAHDGAY